MNDLSLHILDNQCSSNVQFQMLFKQHCKARTDMHFMWFLNQNCTFRIS